MQARSGKPQLYGTFFTSESRERDHTLRAMINKSIDDYANNLPFLQKISCQDYKRHLTSIDEIDLASQVFAHIQGQNNPCEMAAHFCDRLRAVLCCHFKVRQQEIRNAMADLYKPSLYAAFHTEELCLAAVHKVLEGKINNRELRSREELGSVPMHRITNS
jgi:hypothetical protein